MPQYAPRVIDLIVVGRARGPLADAAAEYERRLARYCTLGVRELKEEPIRPGDRAAAHGARAPARRARSSQGAWLVVLDAGGKQLSSEELAVFVREREETAPQRTAFVIGGPQGLAPELRARRAHGALARPGDPAAPARAGRARRGALPGVHDPAERALPPLVRGSLDARPVPCGAMPDPLALLAAPLAEAALRLGAEARRSGSSDRPTSRTASTRRRSPCASPSRCDARRARSPRRCARRRSRASGSPPPRSQAPASSTCARRPPGTPRPPARR